MGLQRFWSTRRAAEKRILRQGQGQSSVGVIIHNLYHHSPSHRGGLSLRHVWVFSSIMQPPEQRGAQVIQHTLSKSTRMTEIPEALSHSSARLGPSWRRQSGPAAAEPGTEGSGGPWHLPTAQVKGLLDSEEVIDFACLCLSRLLERRLEASPSGGLDGIRWWRSHCRYHQELSNFWHAAYDSKPFRKGSWTNPKTGWGSNTNGQRSA